MTFDMMTLMKQGRSFSGRVVAFLVQVGAMALKTMFGIGLTFIFPIIAYYGGSKNCKVSLLV